jgi:hypothetical protein
MRNIKDLEFDVRSFVSARIRREISFRLEIEGSGKQVIGETAYG